MTAGIGRGSAGCPDQECLQRKEVPAELMLKVYLNTLCELSVIVEPGLPPFAKPRGSLPKRPVWPFGLNGRMSGMPHSGLLIGKADTAQHGFAQARTHKLHADGQSSR